MIQHRYSDDFIYIIRESTIEDYVLRLQKLFELSNEKTKQLLNYFLLQYMLKNPDIHAMLSKDAPPDSELSFIGTQSAKKINQVMVIPFQKQDFFHFDFEKIVAPNMSARDSAVASTKHSATSYDMWRKYLESFELIRANGSCDKKLVAGNNP